MYKGQNIGIREVITNSDGSSSEFVYLDKAPVPSEFMFIMDTKNNQPKAQGKAMIYNIDASWNARIWQGHDPGLGATVLFGDGHAAFEPEETFKDLFGSQVNFAYSALDAW